MAVINNLKPLVTTLTKAGLSDAEVVKALADNWHRANESPVNSTPADRAKLTSPSSERPLCCITFTRPKNDEHLATLRWRDPGNAVCYDKGCRILERKGATQVAALAALLAAIVAGDEA